MNALTKLLTVTFFAGAAGLALAEENRCDEWAAKLESIEGEVLWQATGSTNWQAAQVDETFCYGDQLRVTKLRAALRLANDTLVRLNEKSTIKLLPEKKSFWLELVEGAGHFLSRTPKDFTVKAPYLNAAVDGTEFVVSTQADNDIVAVFEGEVSVSDGSQSVSLTHGQQTQYNQNLGVTTVSFRDAAQWALYAPPLIVQAQSHSDIQQRLNKGDVAGTYQALNAQSGNNSQLTALKASLALALGDIAGYQQAQQQLDPTRAESLALQALHDLFVKGDTASALEKSQHALAKDANNTSALMAHTYSLQANTKIEEAYASAEQALSLGTNNAYALARTAELALSIGKADRAEALISKAQSEHPEFSRIYTLAGFTALNRFKSDQAEQKFKRAIELDSADGLAHFGLALSLINQGHIDKGQKKMELAVLLDPSNSLYRSYLGKTYFEQQQFSWAETQYLLAKQLDPNDPTPYFYEAHLAKEQNELPKALELINEAIEKNDNRAVYRSRMLLDSDVAARSANQAQIYLDLGFDEQARDSATLLMGNDRLDPTQHRAAFMTFSDIKSSEAVLANTAKLNRLTQPISAPALEVGAGEVGLLIHPWALPSKLGSQEFSSLFAEQGLNGTASLAAGNNQTRGHSANISARGENFLISGGKYRHESLGTVTNNDIDLDISEASVHYQIKKTKLLLRSIRRNESYGDLINSTKSDYFNQNIRTQNFLHTYQVGLYYRYSENFGVMISHDLTKGTESTSDIIEPFPGVQIPFEVSGKSDRKKTDLALTYSTSFGRFDFTHSNESLSNEIKDPFFGNLMPLDEYKFQKTSAKFTSNEVKSHRFLVSAANYQSDSQVSDISADNSNTGYEIGWHYKPYKNFTITAGGWEKTSERLPRTGELDNGLIFDIDTNSDSNNFTDTKGVSFRTTLKKKNHYFSSEGVKLNHERANITEIGVVNQTTEETQFKINYELLISSHYSFHLNSTVYDAEQTLDLQITNARDPQKMRSTETNIGVSLFFSNNLQLGIDFLSIEQSLSFVDTTTATNEIVEFNKSNESTNLFDLKLKYTIPSSKWHTHIDIKNITNTDHSLLQGKLRDISESFTPQIIEWPNERTIYLSTGFQF